MLSVPRSVVIGAAGGGATCSSAAASAAAVQVVGDDPELASIARRLMPRSTPGDDVLEPPSKDGAMPDVGACSVVVVVVVVVVAAFIPPFLPARCAPGKV